MRRKVSSFLLLTILFISFTCSFLSFHISSVEASGTSDGTATVEGEPASDPPSAFWKIIGMFSIVMLFVGGSFFLVEQQQRKPQRDERK